MTQLFTVNVKLTETEACKNILNVIKDMTDDERIPKMVRCEYIKKILSMMEDKSNG